MPEDALRLCDVCGREIRSTDDYSSITIPVEAATWLRPLLKAQGVKATEDGEGNLKLDICSECRGTMGGLGGGEA
jgi:hypothetical protein